LYFCSQAEFNKLTYSIYGPTTAFTYFEINPDNGQIRLRQSLQGITQTTFQVFL